MSTTSTDFEQIRALEDRYSAVIAQSRRYGALTGALRGAALGAALNGESGFIGGALLGAVLGSNYASYATLQMLKERDEFLTRRDFLENIVNFTDAAAQATEHDLNLVGRAIDGHLTSSIAAHRSDRDELAVAVSVISDMAEIRADVIEDALFRVELSEQDTDIVTRNLRDQWRLIALIRQKQQELASAEDADN